MRYKETKKNPKAAIIIKDVSKSFIVPHEKVNTLRGVFTGLFKKNQYDILHALKNISFNIKKGEFIGIVGRNGSGKSTLLKILAGVYTAGSGSVFVDGAISPFLELGIGFNPELSGRDNVYLNAIVLGLSEKEIDEKFDEIVEFSELGRFIDQKLKNYSSGMNMRLAFSVAIHANRDILLMDEVLAVGDSNFQSKCITEFMKHRAQGRTIIFVTHDIGSVQKYCDRAILLRNGELVKMGIPEDVCNAYIQQNMEDEQVRMTMEQSHRDHKPAKIILKKSVEILKADFIDETGDTRQVFETGEIFAIRISFKINKPVSILNIGVGIHAISGGQVFGCNTQMDGYLIDLSKSEITFKLNEMPILKGDYYLNVVCFGEVEQDYYDVKPQFKNLKIYTSGHKYRYKGILDIDHSWEG